MAVNGNCYLAAAVPSVALGQLDQLSQVVVLLLQDGHLSLQSYNEGLAGVLGAKVQAPTEVFHILLIVIVNIS